jgi:hypothetical protein
MSQPTIQAPATAGTASESRVYSWIRRHPVAIFLVALSFAIFTAPFDERFKDGDLLESLRLTVMLLAALLAVGGRTRSIIWGIVLVTPAMLCKWLNHLHPELVPGWAPPGPGLLFIAFVISNLLRFILFAPRIDSEVLCASVAVYLMLALLWAFAYILVGNINPNAFAYSTGPDSSHVMKGVTALYFSFATLSTVGYGDIAPVGGAARMLAAMEATVGVFYTTVLIARLVSLYSAPTAPAEPKSGE